MKEELKVGDKVLRSAHYSQRILIIIRETATQWITSEGRFLKRNGRLIGGGTWSGCSIEPLTPEAKARYLQYCERTQRQNLWYKITKLPTPGLSVARLQEIYEELKGTK